MSKFKINPEEVITKTLTPSSEEFIENKNWLEKRLPSEEIAWEDVAKMIITKTTEEYYPLEGICLLSSADRYINRYYFKPR